MSITVVFKKVGFNINIGKSSATHSQIAWFSIDKVYFDKSGEIYFAKQLVAI